MHMRLTMCLAMRTRLATCITMGIAPMSLCHPCILQSFWLARLRGLQWRLHQFFDRIDVELIGVDYAH